jgi:hypothetical protein
MWRFILNTLKTDQQVQTSAVFLQSVSAAVGQLKQQLQHDYEQAYPELREIVHLVLDEEETTRRCDKDQARRSPQPISSTT